MYWITVSNSQKSKMYRHSKQILLWFQNKKMYVLSFFWHYWMCYYDFDIKNHFPRFHLAFSPFSCDFKDIFIITLLRCNHIQSWLNRKTSPQWRHRFRWTKQTSSAKTYLKQTGLKCWYAKIKEQKIFYKSLKRLCPSNGSLVHWSIGTLVHWSIGPSVDTRL